MRHALRMQADMRATGAGRGRLPQRRRWPGESVPEYLERISGLCIDLSTMLAAQRRNGLEYRP